MERYVYFKRYLEYYQVNPTFRELMKSSPSDAAEMTGYGEKIDAELAAEAVDIIRTADFNSERARNNSYIQIYVNNNMTANSYVSWQRDRNRYSEKSLYDYEELVRNRCFLECETIRKHPNIYYFPICYELSRGCRVQCDFCGLAAEKFCGNFEYNDENRKLYIDILKVSREYIGDAADTGPLYFATEPFDNPDYEEYIRDYISVFGSCPQTTTALADAYPDRVRKLMEILGSERMEKCVPLRFSIRSIPQFEKIMRIYSPEELAFVELLPNNKESIAGYSDSGRVRSSDRDDRSKINYSICCVSGVKVNLFEKSVSFIEPEVPDQEYPTGVRVLETLYFQTAEEYQKAIQYLYTKYAHSELPLDIKLGFNKYIKVLQAGNMIRFEGDRKGFDISGSFIINRSIEILKEGSRTFNELKRKLGLFGDMEQSLYNVLNVLYKRGYLRIYC